MKNEYVERYLAADYEYLKYGKGNVAEYDDAVLHLIAENIWSDDKSPIQLIYETEFQRANAAGDDPKHRSEAAQFQITVYIQDSISKGLKKDSNVIQSEIMDLTLNILTIRGGHGYYETLSECYDSLADSRDITNLNLAKREISRLNKSGKRPEEIADEMIQRCDFNTMFGMCKAAQRKEVGEQAFLERAWGYLMKFINMICLGKDVTGIKTQENVEKELLRRTKEPEAGGRGQE